jgi:hypothetical protein
MANPIVERCIEDCLRCLRLCAECRDESLTEDPAGMAESVRLCSDCLEICRSCVVLLAGNSQFANQVCGVCADICEACAAECAKYPDMETMRKCAEACRRCESSCREVAKAGPIRRSASA